MILAVDVSYLRDAAVAAGVLFRNWSDEQPLQEFVKTCRAPDSYIPGQFYRRELPCLASLLENIPLVPDFIVIDGFVHLGYKRTPGLGRHLRVLLEEKAIVIGVAKKPFKDTPQSCELLRGSSRVPLYVTADGIGEDEAKNLIRSMHGRDRAPTLLRYVDRLSRTPPRS